MARRRRRRNRVRVGRALFIAVWYLLVSLPVYIILFYVFMPSIATAVAARPDPYDNIWWWLVRARRQSINIKRYGALTCRSCGRQDRRVEYHCHHIQYRAHRPALFLSIWNTEVLCAPCHEELHANDHRS